MWHKFFSKARHFNARRNAEDEYHRAQRYLVDAELQLDTSGRHHPALPNEIERRRRIVKKAEAKLQHLKRQAQA